MDSGIRDKVPFGDADCIFPVVVVVVVVVGAVVGAVVVDGIVGVDILIGDGGGVVSICAGDDAKYGETSCTRSTVVLADDIIGVVDESSLRDLEKGLVLDLVSFLVL